jgi:hypothetical protein
MKRLLAALAASVVCLLLLTAQTARAEVIVRGTTAELQLHSDGTLAGEHSVEVAVGASKRGHRASVDLLGVGPDLTVDDEAEVLDGAATVVARATVLRLDATRIRLAWDGRSVSPGTYHVRVRYRVDGRRAGWVRIDGPIATASVVLPAVPSGVGGAKLRIVLPGAPEVPTLDSGDPPTGTWSYRVVRKADGDVLEAERVYVARGEVAVARVRFGARALMGAMVPPSASVSVSSGETARHDPDDAALSAPLTARSSAALAGHWKRMLPSPASLRAPWVGPALEAFFGLLVAWSTFVLVSALGHGSTAAVRFGFCVGAGAVAACASAAVVSSVLLMLAGLAVCERPAVARPRQPRGPGLWRGSSPEWVFAKWARPAPPRTTLVAVAVLGAAAALSVAVAPLAPDLSGYLTLGALPFLPAFVFRKRAFAAAPPDGTSSFEHLERLERVYWRLRPERVFRVLPSARIPKGRHEPDEVRLELVLRRPVRGLVTIELGYPTPPVPEMLVRVEAGSEAEARLRKLAPGTRSLPGRRQGERVFAFRPWWPSVTDTVRLAKQLASELSSAGPREWAL